MSTPSRSDLPWATGALALVLLGFHVGTALWAPRLGLPVAEALLQPRLRWFRQQIGGQHRRLLDEGEWERLASSVLVHADLLHLGLNTMALVAVGTWVERLLGRLRLVSAFLFCGVVGSAASWKLGPTVSDGASGAVFGLLGLLIAHGVRSRATLEAYERTLLLRWLPGFVVANLVLSGFVPTVDIVAHLGGLASGLLLGFVPRSRGVAVWFEAAGVVLVLVGGIARSL